MFKSVTFEIIGDQRLNCEKCEQHVARLLKTMQGVAQVRAQVSDQHVEVLFDTAAVESTAIAQRLGEAGYVARVVS
ncbi:ATPase P [Burkholderia ubonensis]|uniref:ATPase P n=1 Tax=Burkholderia ubonensis TaxID=101571 RepID=A0AB73FRZ2_9BURK|nr:heavy-metal-associated domain-containing protein [Burkholderia ubonensis]KVK87578.1 ATPase P [Burkholderia ubonensis]KVL66106.1 ATPase P [Burkholderia ubonensis]KVM19844.1 ATPase P [Burkholderia ubonensis]KVM26725.1 ATPase P [Burkholderia ubonensis]KWK68807.1 ATPase P [Burkholderia ubonensis]